MLFSPLIPDRDALFENIVLLLVYHAMCFPPSSFIMSLPPELPFRYPCNHHTIDCRDNFSVCQCRPSRSNRTKSNDKDRVSGQKLQPLACGCSFDFKVISKQAYRTLTIDTIFRKIKHIKCTFD